MSLTNSCIFYMSK